MNRNIKPALFKFIDDKLAADVLAQTAIHQNDPRTLFTRALLACNGIREATGHNDGPMVELIQSTLGGADNEPWCMGFVQSGLAYVEQKMGVKSPVAASEHCVTVWKETPLAQRVKAVPAPGAIIIWRHGSTSSGHTGITISPVAHGDFSAIEGNTEKGMSPTGAVERDVVQVAGGRGAEAPAVADDHRVARRSEAHEAREHEAREEAERERVEAAIRNRLMLTHATTDALIGAIYPPKTLPAGLYLCREASQER